jgi:5,10-methylenetetrahydromethanopterin reductase
MPLDLSCAFATSPESHEHARIAEELGYKRAWFYDSPPLYPDVWVQLCRAAERTSRIGLGPGVLVPSNRHPLTNASAIATLVSLAGEERVAIGVGSGFTGRVAVGQRALSWKYVSDYIQALQKLLLGEQVMWEGALIQMLHTPGYAPPRPIKVPWIVGAAGPKGVAVAREVGDGIFGGGQPFPGFGWSVALTMGTVLDDGEDPGSDHAVGAAGHAAAVMMHYGVEHNVLAEPFKPWAAVCDSVPKEERHLAMHYGHLVLVNKRDRPFITGELLQSLGLALPASGWKARLEQLEANGATEIAYQPAGDDIPRELEAFAKAARN